MIPCFRALVEGIKTASVRLPRVAVLCNAFTIEGDYTSGETYSGAAWSLNSGAAFSPAGGIMNKQVLFFALFRLATAESFAVESPSWWKETRSIYASFDLSGAGGPLMKFPSDSITGTLKSFTDLPVLLSEAKQLGCRCIYLISYWEPHYENKGDYEIRTDLGGEEALKEGVEKVHAAGGRVILYLEPFLIQRTSRIGRSKGRAWCMKDARGRPQTYYGRSRFYLMWPGEGSGWTDYICSVAERLVRDFNVDGFHLDSYGCQWDLKDADPRHTGSFNEGAIRLVRTLRERIRTITPDAIVMLECCERPELLDLCDGGQIESGAWLYSPVKVLRGKQWVNERTYKAFTSHYSMEEMDKVYAMGYNFSLSPWWRKQHTAERDFQRMHRHITDPDDWIKRMRILWNWDNLLYVNGRERPRHIDLFQLRRDLEMRRYAKPKPEHYETDAYREAVNAYEPLVRKALQSKENLLTAAEYLRRKQMRPAEPPRGTIRFRTSGVRSNIHPFLFYTRDQIARAQKRAETDHYAAALSNLNREADKAQSVTPASMDNAWWRKEKEKPWSETYPVIFEKTCLEPLRMARPAFYAALRYTLFGNAGDAKAAKKLLLHLSDYTFEYEHYDVGMNYAVWGHLVLNAYDLLFSLFEKEEHATMERFFSRMAQAVLKNDIYWIENNIGGGINNHLAWHKMLLGAAGLFYGKDQLVRYALHGRRGICPLLDAGLVDNGLWCENSLNYHFTAIIPMVLFAEALLHTGYKENLYTLRTAGGRTLRQPFDAMFDVLFPDGSIPPIGDTYGMRKKLQDEYFYTVVAGRFGDPRYKWLLEKRKPERPESLLAEPAPAASQPPRMTSRLFRDHGYAFLRSSADADYWKGNGWSAFLTFAKSGVHGHQDTLSLMLFSKGTLLLPDVEARSTVPHSFSSAIQRQLNRTALSQNTVMIDGRDQRGIRKNLSLDRFTAGTDAHIVAASDTEGLLYKGVSQSRTIIACKNYVFDVFQVKSETPRQIHWIAHTIGTPGDVTATVALKPAENTLTHPAASWLSDFRTGSGSGPITITTENDTVRYIMQIAACPSTAATVCGYPETDRPESPRIPMILLERKEKETVFCVLHRAESKKEPRGSSSSVSLVKREDRFLLCRVTIGDAVFTHRINRLP